MSAGVVALRADGLDFAADAAAGVNAALMKISHIGFVLLDRRTYLSSRFCLFVLLSGKWLYMNGLTPSDATLHGGKCHTWDVLRCGIRGAGVWHPGC